MSSLLTPPRLYAYPKMNVEHRFVLTPVGWTRIVMRCQRCQRTLTWSLWAQTTRLFDQGYCVECITKVVRIVPPIMTHVA